MKKLLVILFVLSILSTSCSNKKEEDSIVTLSMLHMLDLTDNTTSNTWNILVTEFEKANPDIKIEMEYLASEAYHDKLRTLALSKRLPDLMYLWPGARTGYVTTTGQVKDLRPFLEGKTEKFSPAAMTQQGKNGEIYELPEQINVTHVMYTNHLLLNELDLTPAATMEELIIQGETIRQAGLIPVAMSNKEGWQIQSLLLGVLTERAGGLDWYTKAIQNNGASFADEEFVNALKTLQLLISSKLLTPGINQASYGSALSDFVNQKAVYLIDGGWRVNNLTTELNDAQKENISFLTLPDIKDQKGKSGSTSSVPGTGFGMNISLSGKAEEAAWKWIWFYSGPEGSKIRQEYGAVPAYKVTSSVERDILVDKLAAFISNSPAAYVMDAVIESEPIGILQASVQEMMLGNKTPEKVAQELGSWFKKAN